METLHIYQLVLLLTTGVCYYNSLDCGFVFDDASAIVDNKDLRPHVPLSRLFWNDFWGTPMSQEKSHKSYRPLCVLTFKINYWFDELAPMSYHLVNAVLHAVVCLLFMKMCQLFLPELTGFLAALLFAVHPVHTEAVTGVVGRAEALSSIFFIAALLSYSKCTGYRAEIKWFPLFLTVILVTVAMLCKEQGITVIGVCCVYEVFIVQRATFNELLSILASFAKGKPHIPAWLPNSVIRALFLVGTTLFLLFARIKVMGAQLPVFTNFDNPASTAPFPARHLTYNYLLPVNAWLLLCPSYLCCDWTMGTIPLLESLMDYRNVFTVIFYWSLFKFIRCMLSGQDKRNRAMMIAVTMMILPFIPASNLFFPVGFVVAERILYAPSMGFCMLVAMGFQILLDNKKNMKPVLWGMMGFLIVIHGVKTHQRNYDWKSEYTLFRSALKVNQNNAKCFNNVGHALEKEEKWEEALEYFRRAAKVQPDDIGAHINVGRTHNTLNQTVDAEAAYKRAMDLFPPVKPGKSYTARVAPNHLNVYLNLATLISKDPTRLLEADKLLRTAALMRPDYIQAYINRGDILVKLGRFEDALNEYRTALKYDPENADCHYNLGVVNLEMGNSRNAILHFEDALKYDPDHMQALYNSAVMLQEAGDPKGWALATKRLEKIMKKNPDEAKIHFTLGMLGMDRKEYKTAEKHFKRCIEMDETFKSAFFNLALLLANHMDRPLDAIPYLEKLLKTQTNHTKALMLMGDINVNHLKEFDAAEKNFEEAIASDPTNVQAHHNLCVVYVEKRDLFKAEKCLTKAHNMAPEEQYIINHLNIVRTRINEAIKAHQAKQKEQAQQQQQAQRQQQTQQQQAPPPQQAQQQAPPQRQQAPPPQQQQAKHQQQTQQQQAPPPQQKKQAQQQQKPQQQAPPQQKKHAPPQQQEQQQAPPQQQQQAPPPQQQQAPPQQTPPKQQQRQPPQQQRQEP